MRRLVSAPAANLADLGRGVAIGWDAFFFRPADPNPLGLIRIGTGLLLLWSLIVTGLDLRDFLGADGWADPATVREILAERPGAWSAWLFVPDGLLIPAFLAALVVVALFTGGVQARWTAPLAWAIAVSTSRRVPVMLFGFDQILATWLLYLAVTGASGQALSWDRWRSRPTNPPSPTIAANLALRLIQLHLCVIYGMAGLAKLQGPSWWNGTAFGLVLMTREFRSLIDVSWLIRYPALVNLATHTTIAFELLYPVLIWNRLARPLLLAVAVVMHLGIGLTLGLNEFGLAMILGNLAFLSGGWLRGAIRVRDGSSPPLSVARPAAGVPGTANRRSL